MLNELVQPERHTIHAHIVGSAPNRQVGGSLASTITPFGSGGAFGCVLVKPGQAPLGFAGDGIVTYVEMTARAQLNPVASVPGLSLEALDRVPDSSLIAGLLTRIGALYGWKPAQLAEEERPAWLDRCPARMFWLLSLQGKPAGMTAYDLHSAHDVEIETFGLLPEFVGKSLGGYALTVSLFRAPSRTGGSAVT